jgi:hypothetical protein
MAKACAAGLRRHERDRRHLSELRAPFGVIDRKRPEWSGFCR